MKAALLVCLAFTVLSQAQHVTRTVPEPPADIKELIAQLPECSRLRDEFESGRFGDGVEKPYMLPMLDHGVRRAYFEFEGKWRHNRVEKIQIVRRLYFSAFDRPNAGITDAEQLREIESSGLQAVLDQAALTRANGAPFRFIDVNILEVPLLLVRLWEWKIAGSRISGSVELFASGWLNTPAREIVVWGRRRHNNLVSAASVGDVVTVTALLHKRKYSQEQLNRALAFALNSRRDNTAAVDLLIKAGADVNARFGEEKTPLMLATALSPCDIPVLLAHGSRIEDHDKWGTTASDQARWRHNERALRLLQSAPEH